MSDATLARYAVITPARNEAENIPRLAKALIRQRIQPACWLIVDNGSTDATVAIAEELAKTHGWIRVVSIGGQPVAKRGAPSVRAFHAGLERLDRDIEFVANVDADISFAPGYFSWLIAEFRADPKLGTASGTCFERKQGIWRQRFVTGDHVWGGSRIYRRACLDDIVPLEQRLGWDGMADAKAAACGWKTRLYSDLPFFHYRPEGLRDGNWKGAVAQGQSAHYMGYRPWYILIRAVSATLRGRMGLGMLWGYVSCVFRGEPRSADARIIEHTRERQHLRHLPSRIRESFGLARSPEAGGAPPPGSTRSAPSTTQQ